MTGYLLRMIQLTMVIINKSMNVLIGKNWLETILIKRSNSVKGFGKDVSKGGREIQRAAS